MLARVGREGGMVEQVRAQAGEDINPPASGIV
jgi:hypothetical protein